MTLTSNTAIHLLPNSTKPRTQDITHPAQTTFTRNSAKMYQIRGLDDDGPDPQDRKILKIYYRRTFTYFSKLPTELRLQIWREAFATKLRVAVLSSSAEFDDDGQVTEVKSWYNLNEAPKTLLAVLRTCREARGEALRFHTAGFYAPRVQVQVPVGRQPRAGNRLSFLAHVDACRYMYEVQYNASMLCRRQASERLQNDSRECELMKQLVAAQAAAQHHTEYEWQWQESRVRSYFNWDRDVVYISTNINEPRDVSHVLLHGDFGKLKGVAFDKEYLYENTTKVIGFLTSGPGISVEDVYLVVPKPIDLDSLNPLGPRGPELRRTQGEWEFVDLDKDEPVCLLGKFVNFVELLSASLANLKKEGTRHETSEIRHTLPTFRLVGMKRNGARLWRGEPV